MKLRMWRAASTPRRQHLVRFSARKVPDAKHACVSSAWRVAAAQSGGRHPSGKEAGRLAKENRCVSWKLS